MTFTLDKEIRISAPVSMVWQALTDPDMIKVYFFGTACETDWKEGSPIYFRGEWNGKPYEDKGVILKVLNEELIRYTYWSAFSGTEDKPENYHIITYSLSEADGQSLLRVTQEGIESEASLQHSDGGWTMILAGLKQMLEH